jgi:hypothetical protein
LFFNIENLKVKEQTFEEKISFCIASRLSSLNVKEKSGADRVQMLHQNLDIIDKIDL